ncbi:ENTH/VHS family protein [Prunus dulcis]|uniref:ENTH/VHS family protein n=1 Tax=Prunus dulcis TaxID=3755 RepID=A0A4Y1RN56_PRUDU|nr:ENTH/VHS family protein [Prunus dulcis]
MNSKPIKVLPAALKVVIEEGDDHGKSVVSRLVGIWKRGEYLGLVPEPQRTNAWGRSASTLGIQRQEAFTFSQNCKKRFTLYQNAEKIVSAFHSVISEHPTEDAEMSKCKSAVHRVRKLEKDVDIACTNAKDPKRKTLSKELEEEENLLKQCIEKLKLVEASRVALVSQLKEALHEQESELENVRTHMQVAQAQAEEATNMRKRLNDEDYVFKPSNATSPPTDGNSKGGQTPRKSAAAIAALVADKLAASSSSQLIMTSVLSTFAAEEAKNAGLTKPSTSSNSFTSMPKSSGTDSMAKPERSITVSDANVFISAQPPAVPPNHSYQSALVPQPQNQAATSQGQFHMLPNPPSQQYLQPAGGVMSSYGYGSIPPLPLGPPPPPPHMVSPMVPLTQQPLQMNQQAVQITQQQPIPLTQQPPAPSFRPLQPPGMVYYGHPHNSQ